MKQRGMALLTVLLLLAVMVALAAVVTERWFFSFQYSLHLHQRLQGKWYAIGVENVAAGLLRLDAADDGLHTHLSQRWATTGPRFPLEDAELEVRINDAQACFNLNALAADDGARKIFTRLLELQEIEPAQAHNVSAAVTDWMTDGDEASPGGAKDNEYAAYDPPYLTSAQPLRHVSELRQIRDVTPAVLARLRPLACVLPEKNLSINLNTLTEEQWTLAAALAEDASETEIRNWLAQRPAAGWETLEQAFAGLKPLAGQRRYLVLNSDYFSLRIAARMADTGFRQESLLQRKGGKVSVVMRYWEAEEE